LSGGVAFDNFAGNGIGVADFSEERGTSAGSARLLFYPDFQDKQRADQEKQCHYREDHAIAEGRCCVTGDQLYDEAPQGKCTRAQSIDSRDIGNHPLSKYSASRADERNFRQLFPSCRKVELSNVDLIPEAIDSFIPLQRSISSPARCLLYHLLALYP
jgi:hypothetical protein